MSNDINGYVSLLYSIADKPLDLWSKHVALAGRIRRIRDDTLHGDKVIEVTGPHDSGMPTNIAIPAKMLDVLNIKLPILVLIIKNLNLRFKFDVQIIDKKRYRRRFSFMTYNLEKLPSINTSVARIPLKLQECWNSLEINLQSLCHKAYGADYEALQRLIIYPNCHLRRVYLQDRHYNHNEIPADMYRAFFDMYMSKWGMNVTDGTCQTECHKEPPQQPKSNRPVKHNVKESKKAHLSKNICSMGRLANLNKFNAIQRNYMSLDTLNSAIKKHDEHFVAKKQSECFTESSMNDPKIAENNPRNSNNAKRENTAQKTWHKKNVPEKSSKVKSNNNTQPVVTLEPNKVTKSKDCKMHISDTVFKNSKSSTDAHSHKVQNAGDTHIFNSENCIAYNGSKDRQAENNIHRTDSKCKIFKPNFSFVSKFNLFKEDVSKFNKVNNDIINKRSDELYTISEDKCVKKNEKEDIIKQLKSLLGEESAEDVSGRVPPLIEKQATLNETKSRNTYLTTIAPNIMAIQKSANKKLLDKLRDRGLFVPQLELSTFTTRRNGHERFIEKQRWSTDKCIG